MYGCKKIKCYIFDIQKIDKVMKRITYLLLFVATASVFASCKKCYDCSNGVDVVQLCDYNRQKINSDKSIYESQGYSCRKK